jgi:hypothetical protein
MGTNNLGRLNDFFISCFGFSKSNIIPDAYGEKIRVLENNALVTAKIRDLDVLNVLVVKIYFPTERVIEPR